MTKSELDSWREFGRDLRSELNLEPGEGIMPAVRALKNLAAANRNPCDRELLEALSALRVLLPPHALAALAVVEGRLNDYDLLERREQQTHELLERSREALNRANIRIQEIGSMRSGPVAYAVCSLCGSLWVNCRSDAISCRGTERRPHRLSLVEVVLSESARVWPK